MIKVNHWIVEVDDSQGLLTTEMALLLHVMRTEYPEKLYAAMEAEDKLYNIKKEGK